MNIMDGRFKTHIEKRRVNETMVSLLYPLENHLKPETWERVQTALWILQHAGIEEVNEQTTG